VLAVGDFTTPPEYPKNNGSVVMEVFKVQDGMIRHIWAFFRGNGQPASGWDDAAARQIAPLSPKKAPEPLRPGARGE
jgi:hypothetical protein